MAPRIRGITTGLAALVLTITSCSEDPAETGESGADDAADSASAEISHVHGLSVVGDRLFVATHHGLFAVSGDGAATMVSDDDHDFMGFTAVDDSRFLASGHPGSRMDLPGNLGLLESTDGGAIWESRSLLGEVDFHAMDATDGIVYGWDSVTGVLMTSTDGVAWDHLDQIRLADVAISPTDDDTVLITTEDGPALSTDTGRTFQQVPDAPLLALVDWPRADALYGIAPDGVVHHSADGGDQWEQLGQIDGQPHAMTVGPDDTIYAATESAIVVSADGADAFTDLIELS